MATRGPSESFMSVCDKELGIDDFYDVYDEIKPLSANWKQIAISFRLRINTINTIEAKHNGKVLNCLQEALEVWLKKDYDYERHGIPCWRKVCVAVKEGADDPALADEIAEEHPATEGATPHTRTARARGAGSSSIYAPMAITNFKLHRELSEIQDKFAEAVEETIKYYTNSTCDAPELIDYITARISTLLSPHEHTPDRAQAVRKEFKDITTINDFFALLQHKYTSWFKHEPITKLIRDKYLEKLDLLDNNYEAEAPTYWTWYEERLHKYFKKCITVVDPASYGITDAPPGEQVIVVKVDRGNYDENDLYFLRQAIPEELDSPNLKLYLFQVLPN